MDGGCVPRRGDIAKQDVREGFPVGVVDEQRDSAFLRDVSEVVEGRVVDDISAWVGRSREADGGDVFGLFDGGEVDGIPELMWSGLEDIGPKRCERSGFSGLVCVSDVFRDGGEEDAPHGSVGACAG